jgi:adenine-specific DNA-methyltransferase
LLSDTGSVFVQIGDENVHLARIICDEIFGTENFISFITVRKSLPLGSKGLAGVCDYLIWYAKNKDNYKYRQLYVSKQTGEDEAYSFLMFPDNTYRRMTQEEKKDPNIIPKDAKIFRTNHLMSAGQTATCFYEFELEGKTIKPKHRSWLTNKEGMMNLISKGRIRLFGNEPQYILYLDDFPLKPLYNLWGNLQGASNPIYVVQTNTEILKRCILMTTDPGDLVLDITCGSGTTAYVAEQWGRRWMTCDTSRIAITLAKKRLMTATFDYYKLAYPDQGVSSGFIYKTVPHITLKSIANNEPPEQETLYGQPEIDRKKIRISGPFTVEALPAPVVKPLESDDGTPAPFFHENTAKKQSDWMQELKATGILGRGGEKVLFSRVEAYEKSKFLHATAETNEKVSRHAVICFAGETRPLDVRMVNQALNEIQTVRPAPSFIIFAAFQFDPTAAKFIDDTNWPDITLLKVQMNIDLMTADLKKKSSGSQSFWLIGQPDVELIKIEKSADKGKYKVKVKGFDYYDVKKGIVESGGTNKIAMWMLDTDYDGMCIEPKQVFFPMEGKNEGWDKLAKTLKSEINQDLIEKYRGIESLPFMVKDNTRIAAKIIDDRGIECLKIISIGNVNG